MSSTSEPLDKDRANGGFFAIPVDHEAARLYFFTLQRIGAIALGISSLGLLYLAWLVYYRYFGKWLIDSQVEAMQYRIEGRTLRADSGVFFLSRKVIPLDRITDFTLHQGPIMRKFGIWSLQVQTAGTSWAEATLVAIENPEHVRDELLRRRDEAVRSFGDSSNFPLTS